MAMRNFWIEANMDGRKTMLTGGPRGKEGGFKLVIRMRENGGSVLACEISGHCDPETGNLVLTSQIENELAKVLMITER